VFRVRLSTWSLNVSGDLERDRLFSREADRGRPLRGGDCPREVYVLPSDLPSALDSDLGSDLESNFVSSFPSCCFGSALGSCFESGLESCLGSCFVDSFFVWA